MLGSAADELVRAVRRVATEQVERELREMRECLKATQERCSELLTENRAMRMAAASLCDPVEWNAAVGKALEALMGKR